MSSLFSPEMLEAVLSNISDLIIKSIISVLPGLQNSYALAKKDNPNSCFQLLGFDVLMTDKMKFKLIEINQNPSLMTDTAVDKILKAAMMKNIFEMIELPLNLNENFPESRLKAKDKHELSKAGLFKRIYPLESLE